MSPPYFLRHQHWARGLPRSGDLSALPLLSRTANQPSQQKLKYLNILANCPLILRNYDYCVQSGDSRDLCQMECPLCATRNSYEVRKTRAQSVGQTERARPHATFFGPGMRGGSGTGCGG